MSRHWYKFFHFEFENAVWKVIDNKSGKILAGMMLDKDLNCHTMRFNPKVRFMKSELEDIVDFMGQF